MPRTLNSKKPMAVMIHQGSLCLLWLSTTETIRSVTVSNVCSPSIRPAIAGFSGALLDDWIEVSLSNLLLRFRFDICVGIDDTRQVGGAWPRVQIGKQSIVMGLNL